MRTRKFFFDWLIIFGLVVVLFVQAFGQKQKPASAPAAQVQADPAKQSVATSPAVQVTPEEKVQLALLKVQIERNNANLRILQSEAAPFISDNQKRQDLFNATLQKILDRYAAENPGYVGQLSWDGDEPVLKGMKQPEQKKEETKAPPAPAQKPADTPAPKPPDLKTKGN